MQKCISKLRDILVSENFWVFAISGEGVPKIFAACHLESFQYVPKGYQFVCFTVLKTSEGDTLVYCKIWPPQRS